MEEKSTMFYFSPNWGMFLGSFSENIEHQHYAIQLSIALTDEITIHSDNGSSQTSSSFLIKSNQNHRLVSPNSQLLFLINPASKMGHFLHRYTSQTILPFQHNIVNQLKLVANQSIEERIKFDLFTNNIEFILKGFECDCVDQSHLEDNRIVKAMAYLNVNSTRVVPLAEIAKYSCLSPSRFLHLFKKETNITYRRAQLWIKISQSFPHLFKQSITETAHQFGFTDSAHYSKTFKQNFGFPPRKILQL